MEVAAAGKKAPPTLPFPVTGILSGNTFRRPEGQAKSNGIRAIECWNDPVEAFNTVASR